MVINARARFRAVDSASAARGCPGAMLGTGRYYVARGLTSLSSGSPRPLANPAGASASLP